LSNDFFPKAKQLRRKRKKRKRKLSQKQPKPKHQAEEARRHNDTQDARLAQEMLDVAFSKGMTPGRHRCRPRDELSPASPPQTARRLAPPTPPPWRNWDPHMTITNGTTEISLANDHANRHR
jgi:hypothetical protein